MIHIVWEYVSGCWVSCLIFLGGSDEEMENLVGEGVDWIDRFRMETDAEVKGVIGVFDNLIITVGINGRTDEVMNGRDSMMVARIND